jgi:hypothetical protein
MLNLEIARHLGRPSASAPGRIGASGPSNDPGSADIRLVPETHGIAGLTVSFTSTSSRRAEIGRRISSRHRLAGLGLPSVEVRNDSRQRFMGQNLRPARKTGVCRRSTRGWPVAYEAARQKHC